ncbi:Ribosomal protein L13 [Cynara cardunculus var. scolymus]|uniref:Ribosomal protein L13 n=1 Tax=Cynara cardunculus var. scolymus TaxID=59895 RepID=A0A124SI00_CYNCS|nr:Ribosomal protein L13 [Cynara cardunculus var. scolymus]
MQFRVGDTSGSDQFEYGRVRNVVRALGTQIESRETARRLDQTGDGEKLRKRVESSREEESERGKGVRCNTQQQVRQSHAEAIRKAKRFRAGSEGGFNHPTLSAIPDVFFVFGLQLCLGNFVRFGSVFFSRPEPAQPELYTLVGGESFAFKLLTTYTYSSSDLSSSESFMETTPSRELNKEEVVVNVLEPKKEPPRATWPPPMAIPFPPREAILTGIVGESGEIFRSPAALARLKVYEGVPTPYNRKKRMVIPDVLKVLRLTVRHKYCLLGQLSSEVGWNHYETIKSRRLDQNQRKDKKRKQEQTRRNSMRILQQLRETRTRINENDKTVKCRSDPFNCRERSETRPKKPTCY